MNILNLLAWTPSPAELIVVCVVIILLFGAKKLPELSRSIGKSVSEFKKGKAEAEKELRSLNEDSAGDSGGADKG
jgi:TatA/E family protein of Tat protein translocase